MACIRPIDTHECHRAFARDRHECARELHSPTPGAGIRHTGCNLLCINAVLRAPWEIRVLDSRSVSGKLVHSRQADAYQDGELRRLRTRTAERSPFVAPQTRKSAARVPSAELCRRTSPAAARSGP